MMFWTLTSVFLKFLIVNTEANDKIEEDAYGRYSKYDYVFSNLSKNLKKEVNGK